MRSCQTDRRAIKPGASHPVVVIVTVGWTRQSQHGAGEASHWTSKR